MTTSRGLSSPPPQAGEVGERSEPGGGLAQVDIAPSLTLPRKRGRERVRRAAWTLSLVLLFADPLTSHAQQPQYVPRDEKPEDYPAGTGRDDTFYLCTACHGFKLVAQQGMTRPQWDDSLQWMTDRHNMAPLPPKERAIVLNYLEATFPPRAPASRGGWQNPFQPR